MKPERVFKAMVEVGFGQGGVAGDGVGGVDGGRGGEGGGDGMGGWEDGGQSNNPVEVLQ